MGARSQCLLQVYNLTGESDEFEQFLYDPSIPKNKKVPALNAILEKMEINEVTKHFFGKTYHTVADLPSRLCRAYLDKQIWHM